MARRQACEIRIHDVLVDDTETNIVVAIEHEQAGNTKQPMIRFKITDSNDLVVRPETWFEVERAGDG
jgi:hypothetical protein